MKTTLNIQNLKCGGCENTVLKGMSEIQGVEDVRVDATEGAVSFEYKQEAQLKDIFWQLSRLGYPVEGENNPLSKKVKSYFSCAKGRFS